ncbi:MAG: Fe-S protein assembly chaperone HscA [Bordetella sp.]|nr:MAG: Fe-S protein assembly chaperone HscA [Bordetella sp.]
MTKFLQISEPNDQISSESGSNVCSIGIDFGTTNSLVVSMHNGFPKIFSDTEGKSLLPSVVHYSHEGNIYVGNKAKFLQGSDPLNTIYSVKRLLGKSFAEISSMFLPYKIIDKEGVVYLSTTQGEFTPIEVSAEIFSALIRRTEKKLNGRLEGAVVTVPAYFDDNQRQAIRDAARLSGLNILRIINEPTAAAIAYGLDNQAEGIYAVYDLGGGTFDISILRLTNGIFEVLSTGGDPALGGDDFDQLIYNFIFELYPNKIRTILDQSILLLASKQARETLSNDTSAHIKISLSDNNEIEFVLTKDCLENIIKPLLQKTINCTDFVISDSGLNKNDIKSIILVGGTTRMPIVRDLVSKFFNQTPLTNIDPDKTVAIGAALQADLLIGNKTVNKDWLLLDVSPLSLGLETIGGLVENIIPRNSTIPVSQTQEFTTFKDGQTKIDIHIVQGERKFSKDCRSLAKFQLLDIPPMTAGIVRIEVTFQIDENGLLNVTAYEKNKGIKHKISVKPSHGLTSSQIEKMISDGLKNSNNDLKNSDLIKVQIELQKLLQSINNAMKVDSDLLDDTEYQHIKNCMKKVEFLKESKEIKSIQEAIDLLSDATKNFATLRMNRSITVALSEKKY